MKTIQLKIGELRKQRGISQQQLAEVLGVSFQSVSKWENSITMPDITLLPMLAEYFEVTVDELLGLKPLPGEEYRVCPSGSKDFWNEKLDYLKRTRASMWNEDYIQFLIEKVWGITEPVDVLDCGCGYGFLGPILLRFLPKGSTYTGVDFSENLIEGGKSYFESIQFVGNLICSDFLTARLSKQYDLVISQAVLRHVDDAKSFLNKMVQATKEEGRVICIDVNREIECDGLFIEGIDYNYLCQRNGIRKMWRKQYKHQGRDYAVAMKVPNMMKELGLKNVDVRMNDKVNFVYPDMDNYKQAVSDFIKSQGWDKQDIDYVKIISKLMNHGMDRKEAEAYCNKQEQVTRFLEDNKGQVSYIYIIGLLISYGIK